ncbi:MAG: hypothetical protein L6R00_02320 [Phycisphaerae bacterium]|nr:hypothetical protein [Phycisphaerae bacterium]
MARCPSVPAGPPRRPLPEDRPLSDAQRAECRRHLPLVGLQLKRQAGVGRAGRLDRDPDDLFQEGAVALLRALRDHDPCRHGDFPPYALARIHYAMGRALCEQAGGIRIPFGVHRRRIDAERADCATQRREPRSARQARGATSDASPSPAERHSDPSRREAAVPREVRHDPDLALRPARTSAGGADARPRLLHLFRERFDAIARRVADDMIAAARDPRSRKDAAAVIVACLHERWLIPEESQRTPFRALAARCGTSLGRLVRCDSTFQQRLKQALVDDPATRWLVERAAEEADGLRYAARDDEVECFYRLCEA